MSVAWYLCGSNENVPCGLLCLNTWSLVGSAFFGRVGELRRCGVVGRSMSLEAGFETIKAHNSALCDPCCSLSK